MLGCFSCAVFFLEPNPFEGDKPDFLLLLTLLIAVIYTADHIIDGYKLKGNSGILRYDFNYEYRKLLIPLCIFLGGIIIWLIYKNKDSTFVKNGLWLSPFLPFYFILKLRGKFSPIVKMLFISLIVSAVVVSLYNSTTIFSDFLSMERITMALMVFLNQLVLEHFEFHEEHPELQPSAQDLYQSLASRIFIWIILMLILITFFNPFSWPYTLAMFVISLFLRLILKYQIWFNTNRKYRYWADFSFILMWPLLKLFLLIKNLL